MSEQTPIIGSYFTDDIYALPENPNVRNVGLKNGAENIS